MTRPNTSGHNFPCFKICKEANDVTLGETDYGNACVYYDIGQLFGRVEPIEPSQEGWKGVAQTVIGAWGIAEAASVHPQQLNGWTKCSMKTLKRLRAWTYIRATKRWPPQGDEPGEMASDSDMAWAALPFDEF